MISPSGQRCACPRRDAYDCWASRYRIPSYEESGDPSFIDDDGGPCECACHDEFACEDEGDWL